MNNNNYGWGFMLIIIMQLFFLPVTGLAWITREDGGLITKIAGWCMLIMGIIFWVGFLGS